DGNTNAMLWKIDELIAYISQFFTLKKGDVLFTGTPEGVGKVSENDVLTGTINGVESFRIHVK
ncbi:MAG: fumarylacetoacetate hydrolase family protein, partial [Lutibacter sp.]|nr:fumarylacetoacetate hydrolase family protein [Lutibacter sp.]